MVSIFSWSKLDNNTVSASNVNNNQSLVKNVDPNAETVNTTTVNMDLFGIGEAVGKGLDAIGDFFSDTAADVGNAVSSVVDDISNTLNDWGDSISSWWSNDAWPIISDVGKTALDVLENVGADICTGITSILEGIGQFAEAIVDLGAIVASISQTAPTLIVDGFQALGGLITGNEWESATKKLWEGTKGFVATEHVKNAFDSFYENNPFGQWMKNNAYGFDVVRGVGSGIGYVAGIITLTVLTFGTGTAAVAGASATSTGISVSAGQLAVTAGAAGVGKGTQKAWSEGAGIGEGLGYGALTGVWEGLQFYLGGKIGEVGGLGDQLVTKLFGENAPKFAGSLARVALDSVDGGAEGFVQPLIDMAYKDGDYNKLFEEAGGWRNVLTQASIGAIMSALGEAGDLRKILKSESSATEGVEDGIERSAREVAEENVDEVLALPGKTQDGTLVGYPIEEAKEIATRESTESFVFGSEQMPHTEEAIIRNQEIVESPEFQELMDSVSSKRKNLADYGATKAESGTITAPQQAQADALAVQKCEMAKQAEPQITDAMKSIESDTRHLTGLDHKLKGEGSMSRKILSDAQELLDDGKVATLEEGMIEAQKKVGDSVRYTMICDPESIATDVKESLQSLYEQGYRIREGKFKNTFDSDIYRGLNVGLEAPDGTYIELQFHTPQSFSVKEETNHIFYEISRNQVVTTEREKELCDAIMREQAAKIEVPQELVEMKEFVPEIRPGITGAPVKQGVTTSEAVVQELAFTGNNGEQFKFVDVGTEGKVIPGSHLSKDVEFEVNGHTYQLNSGEKIQNGIVQTTGALKHVNEDVNPAKGYIPVVEEIDKLIDEYRQFIEDADGNVDRRLMQKIDGVKNSPSPKPSKVTSIVDALNDKGANISEEETIQIVNRILEQRYDPAKLETLFKQAGMEKEYEEIMRRGLESFESDPSVIRDLVGQAKMKTIGQALSNYDSSIVADIPGYKFDLVVDGVDYSGRDFTGIPVIVNGGTKENPLLYELQFKEVDGKKVTYHILHKPKISDCPTSIVESAKKQGEWIAKNLLTEENITSYMTANNITDKRNAIAHMIGEIITSGDYAIGDRELGIVVGQSAFATVAN